MTKEAPTTIPADVRALAGIAASECTMFETPTWYRIKDEVQRAIMQDRTDRVSHLSNCAECGRIIDTREVSEGGDRHGCEISDGRWVCSIECYDVQLGPSGVLRPVPKVEERV